MSRGGRLVAGSALGLHFLFIVTNSVQDIVATLPVRIERSTLNESHSTVWKACHSTLRSYFDITGIEGGYSFFAPNVPGNAKLVFELRYPDGHFENRLPEVGGVGGGDRISALIDQLRFIHYLRLRQALLRSLVDVTHREHSSATLVRAVLGDAVLTTPAQYRAGKRISYHPLFAYDFHYGKKTTLAGSP